jgi:TP901 family phage tail tape measure protein
MNQVEESTVVFRLDGRPFVSELTKIEAELDAAKDKLSGLEKGTKEWSAQNKNVKELELAVKSARQQMDLSQLTVKQLTALQGDMVKVMKQSVVGSEEYNAAAEKLKQINPILQGVRQDMRGIGEETIKQIPLWQQFKEDFTRAFSVFSVFEALKAIYNFVSESVREFKVFQSAAADLSAVTGATGDDLKYLTDTAKETAPQFGMMGSEMLEAYKMMASAKPELLDQKELLASTTNEAIKLAQASKMELKPATDALASSLNQFGQPASSASRFINVMAAGAKEGSAEINEMAAALKNSGTVASASKVSFEQTNAILQSLSTIALKGGEAGNQLKNVLLTLSAGAKETNPQVVGLDKAIENLGNKQLSTAEIAKLFGKENVVAAQHIITHGKEITELTKKLTGTSEAYSQAAKNTNTLDFQTKQASSTISTLKTEIGSGLEPILVKVIGSFISFVNIVRAVPAFIKDNKEMIIALGVAIIAFNGHLIKATALSLLHTAAEKTRTIVTEGVTIAQNLLNTTLRANPIGAVIAAVSILVGALITWYQKSDTVKASVSGLWNTIKTLITVVSDAYRAFTTFDFAKLSDIFKNGATKIGNSFNEGYNAKMTELRKQNEADNQKHLNNTANASKATAKTIAENDVSEHKETLSKKELAAAKHRQEEIKRAKEKAQKEREDQLKEENQALSEIKKMDIERIKDENAREVAQLKFKHQQELAQIAQSKASQTTKASWEKALNDKLIRDIDALETKARNEKIADEKKAASEIAKDQDTKRQAKIKNSFDAEKAINEFELLTARNNQNEIQRLKLQRLDIEKRETMAKLDAELQAEKRTLQEAYESEVAKAAASGRDTTEIHRRYRADQMSLDQKYLAESSLAIANYQQAKTKEQEDHNKLREENHKKFYAGLKALMDGDYNGFIDGLTAKLGADTKNLDARTKNFVSHTDKVGEYANMGFDFLKKLSDLRLQQDVNNLNKEKETQLKAWEEKYSKGLISKDEYESKTDELNKQYAAKEQQLRKEAFEKQKKMDIAQALINGALAVVKSLAMFGWPFGLIAAAAAGVMTAVQVASISSRTFAQKGAVIKNAGVPQGSRHGNKYGDAGIQLIDRTTGHEIGEMEGGEPIMILSRNTYQNNRPVVDKLLHSSLHRNGAPIYRDGGLMFENGGTIDESVQDRIREKREAERQQQEEKQQSDAVQAEANTTAGDGNSPAANNGMGDTTAQEQAIAENTKLQKEIASGVTNTVQELKDSNLTEREILSELRGMRGDMNRLLNSINSNTAKTADRTANLSSLAVIASKFK